jgi:hypothetical protein
MLRICVALLLFVCPIAAQRSSDQPKLAVSIRSVTTKYRINDEIRLEVQLSNVGHVPVLIRKEFFWGVGRTHIRVFDPRHKEVFTDFLADAVPWPPKEEAFLKLGPGEFFGTALVEAARDFVNNPGIYKFTVDYTSTVPEAWAHQYLKLPDVPLWTRERGTISSSEIQNRAGC